MPNDVYRLTINGGAKVAWGRIERCALAAIPLLIAGQTVHLRNLGNPGLVISVYAEGHLRIAKPTMHGELTDLPEWGVSFLRIINYSIGADNNDNDTDSSH